MKIILLKDVAKLGKMYDIKDVNSGHALNMLIPRGLALPATAEATKRIESLKAKSEGEKAVIRELIAKNLKELADVNLTITGKANAKGNLFAGLHREEIAKELETQTRLQIDPSFIDLEHPIKEVGEHKINVKAEGKTVSFKLTVNATK